MAYPTLDKRIADTYAKLSTAKTQRTLYDSYLRAFRWATDRVGDHGVVAFVSNGGWIDGNTADGIRLIGRSRGINAAQFGATWSRRMKGARFAFKRGGDRSPHEGSFIATGKSGNRLVFERKGKSRLPLQAIYGPSVGQMLKHGRRPERLAEFAIRVLEAEQRRLLGAKL